MAGKSSEHTHLNGRDLLSFLSLSLSFFSSRRGRSVSSHSADEHGFEARCSDWRAAVDPSRLPAQGHLRGGGGLWWEGPCPAWLRRSPSGAHGASSWCWAPETLCPSSPQPAAPRSLLCLAGGGKGWGSRSCCWRKGLRGLV